MGTSQANAPSLRANASAILRCKVSPHRPPQPAAHAMPGPCPCHLLLRMPRPFARPLDVDPPSASHGQGPVKTIPHRLTASAWPRPPSRPSRPRRAGSRLVSPFPHPFPFPPFVILRLAFLPTCPAGNLHPRPAPSHLHPRPIPIPVPPFLAHPSGAVEDEGGRAAAILPFVHAMLPAPVLAPLASRAVARVSMCLSACLSNKGSSPPSLPSAC